MAENTENRLLYRIALTLLPGVGAAIARKLLSVCGPAELMFHERPETLSKVPGIPEKVISSFREKNTYLSRAEKELAFIQKFKVQTYYLEDENYPVRLKQCTDSPLLLYALGNADYNHPYVVSIVGTRNASDYGREMCSMLINGLARLGVLLVSGLAYGIDTCAHKYAVESGQPTVAVLAHGLDRIYPSVNTHLAQKMIHNGGLITEFISGTKPDRENFPMRNRIIAGLSDATIVIEAGPKGGALITAEIAGSYDRDVFAVPGRIGDAYSQGCNTLIKTNRAALVQKAEDIFYIMGWDLPKENHDEPMQPQLFRQLSADEQLLVNILAAGECSLDFICAESRLNIGKVATALLQLELDGLVSSMPGKRYRLTMKNA